MAVAYQLANEIGLMGSLPMWCEDPAECARVVEVVEERAVNPWSEKVWQDIDARGGYEANADILKNTIREYFQALAEDPESAPGIGEANQRMNLLLRLWSGCISAGKTIANQTNSGPNTSQSRKLAFQDIDAIAAMDPAYRAGVIAAPSWKALRKQSYHFDGVPEESPVRICAPQA